MELTQRQRDVSERLIEGMTIAAIAEDLGLTESRVNQIIRALKNRFEVDTQAGVVAAYQRTFDDLSDQSGLAEEPQAPTAMGTESLVPQLLNPPHTILYRVVAICLAALLLAVTFFVLTELAISLSENSESRRVVTIDNGRGTHG